MVNKLTRDLAIKRNNAMQGVISKEWETRTLILIQQSGPLRGQWKSSGEAVLLSPPGRDRAKCTLIFPDGVVSQKVN